MANKVGYWYFINSADFDPKTGRLTLEWENRGMAHAFKRYALFVKIRSCDGKFERVFPIASADNRKGSPIPPFPKRTRFPSGICLPENTRFRY